jgi:hypothetical protein
MSPSFVIVCTSDGTWTARDPHTEAFATGATRSKAEAELRRLVAIAREAA